MLRRLASWQTASLLVLALSVPVGLHFGLLHLGESLWQDEASTLAFHASRGVAHPFFHYVAPNNHIGFSAMLAFWMGWFPDGLQLETLRWLPLVLFLTSIPACFAAGYRLGGPLCAAFAVICFATSPVSENFATQLRGYGPSWLFMSLAFLSAMSIAGGRNKTAWAFCYLSSGLVTASLLPTNVLFLEVIGLSAVGTIAASGSGFRPGRRGDMLFLLAAPVFAFLVAYSMVWSELMRLSAIDFSNWSRSALLLEWFRGSTANFLWTTPLAAAAMVNLAIRLSSGRNGAKSGDPSLVMAVLLASGCLMVVVLMPNTPFPRTLVPFLPVWICAMAYMILSGARAVFIERGRPASLAAGVSLLALLLASPGMDACRGERGSTDKFKYNLCYQYFRDEYHPEAVLNAWAELGNLEKPIVGDFESYRALQILGSPARLFEYRNYPATSDPAPLIVAHDDADLATMAGPLSIDPRKYVLVRDTGYFKLYAPVAIR